MNQAVVCVALSAWLATSFCPGSAGFVIAQRVVAPAAESQDQIEEPRGEEVCNVDLKSAGMMQDVVSNVLSRVAKLPEEQTRPFLDGATERYASGDELVRAAAAQFGINEAKLAAEAQRMKHVNCTHGPIVGPDGAVESVPDENRDPHGPAELTPFARDVALHVVLHEIGHGLIREFDLPVLGNEETMADAFATHYLVTHLPDRAFDVILARTTSLMVEAAEVPRERWPVRGEHDSDARRAYQIAALAVAADRKKYQPIAASVGLSASDMRSATDYGAEIHRSWRRVLQPLMMPEGLRSNEAEVECDLDESSREYASHSSLIAELDAAIRRFDWHSKVHIRFVCGDGGAAWNRSKRAITVHSAYLRRFVDQGRCAELIPPAPIVQVIPAN